MGCLGQLSAGEAGSQAQMQPASVAAVKRASQCLVLPQSGPTRQFPLSGVASTGHNGLADTAPRIVVPWRRVDDERGMGRCVGAAECLWAIRLPRRDQGSEVTRTHWHVQRRGRCTSWVRLVRKKRSPWLRPEVCRVGEVAQGDLRKLSWWYFKLSRTADSGSGSPSPPRTGPSLLSHASLTSPTVRIETRLHQGGSDS
jgi:hypothetical protein